MSLSWACKIYAIGMSLDRVAISFSDGAADQLPASIMSIRLQINSGYYMKNLALGIDLYANQSFILHYS
jgi:hypothetical protein